MFSSILESYNTIQYNAIKFILADRIAFSLFGYKGILLRGRCNQCMAKYSSKWIMRLWQKGDQNQCFVQAFRFPPSWQIKGSELSIGLQVNELNGFHFVSPPLLLFCNAIVWSMANPLLSEGGTRCYSSQRQFPHCRRLSVPLPISSTFFPRALLGHTSDVVYLLYNLSF